MLWVVVRVSPRALAKTSIYGLALWSMQSFLPLTNLGNLCEHLFHSEGLSSRVANLLEATMSTVYIGGHQPSVLKSHTWRTAENSAGYLLPYLRPNMHLLDVGCGPGTITLDLALRLPQGHVSGIDPSDSVIAQARETAASRGISNVTFMVGDVFALQEVLREQKFDVVHAHQVLQVSSRFPREVALSV